MKPDTSVNQAWCRLRKTQVERGFSKFQQEGRIELDIAMHMLGHRTGFTPHPSPLPEDRELICGLFKSVFASVSQVGVTRTFNSVSSLSLRERARVRAF